MALAFRELAARLATSRSAVWAARTLELTPIAIAEYDLFFAQIGLAIPPQLRASLVRDGAFEIVRCEAEVLGPKPDGSPGLHAVYSLHEVEPLTVAHDLVMDGIRMYDLDDLFHAYDARQTEADTKQRSILEFASGFYGHCPYAFDTRFERDREYRIVRFHSELDSDEPTDVPPSGSAPGFDVWARQITDQIVGLVEQLEFALQIVEDRNSVGRPTDEALARVTAQLATRKRWHDWSDDRWRLVLARGTPEAARDVLAVVGTITTSREHLDRLPHPCELLHRLPETGPMSRRNAIVELFAQHHPEHGELIPAYDYLLASGERADPAPSELLAELAHIGWADRGIAIRPDVRWARALLWALGQPRPLHLFEAVRLALAPTLADRPLVDVVWRHLEQFAQRAGVL